MSDRPILKPINKRVRKSKIRLPIKEKEKEKGLAKQAISY